LPRRKLTSDSAHLRKRVTATFWGASGRNDSVDVGIGYDSVVGTIDQAAGWRGKIRRAALCSGPTSGCRRGKTGGGSTHDRIIRHHRGHGGHYDVYQGSESFDDVIQVELEFLHRHAKKAD
jgi:hypothetical protein